MSRLAPELKLAFFGAAALMAVSRPYLGMHYPSDVVVVTTVLNPDGSPKVCWVEPCPVEFGDLVLVEVAKPFEIRVLGWRAEGELPASHQVRAQHGAWVP